MTTRFDGVLSCCQEFRRYYANIRSYATRNLAQGQGIAYCTAWRWVRQDRMPVPWSRTPSGTILVQEATPAAIGPVALYARVSSSDQKHDLERQLGRLTEYATRNGMAVVRSVSEIGSGLGGHRPKLRRLLADQLLQTIIVEHRDRLARFGSEYLEAALLSAGRTLVVHEFLRAALRTPFC